MAGSEIHRLAEVIQEASTPDRSYLRPELVPEKWCVGERVDVSAVLLRLRER